MTGNTIQYSQNQQEIISTFKEIISKAAVKISEDSENFTAEALSVLDKVYVNPEETLTITALAMAATRENDGSVVVSKYHAFATIALSSILTLHAKNLRHGVASLLGMSETASAADLGDIISHSVNININLDEKNILGCIAQTIIVNSDSTVKCGDGMFAPLTGGNLFEGTWFTSTEDSAGWQRDKSSKSFSKLIDYDYVGISYLTFGLKRQDKMFEQFDENNNGFLGNKLNDSWFLISQITPMPDSFFYGQD